MCFRKGFISPKDLFKRINWEPLFKSFVQFPFNRLSLILSNSSFSPVKYLTLFFQYIYILKNLSRGYLENRQLKDLKVLNICTVFHNSVFRSLARGDSFFTSVAVKLLNVYAYEDMRSSISKIIPCYREPIHRISIC